MSIDNSWQSIIIVLLIVLLCALLFRMKKIRRDVAEDRITDVETGLGNLRFFKDCFKNTISDDTRALYYIAYIILDNRYLRSYHSENSFDSMLKHAASVITGCAEDGEFAARISESGFVLAIKEDVAKTAKARIEEVVSKLNSFKGVRENDEKLVFHCAAYNLSEQDKNCEIMLFNLRKNCNNILGTGKSVVFCDAYAMNKVQERKVINERLEKALDNGEFKMFIQFIVDNKTKKIVLAEALSRWEQKDKTIVGPGAYIGNLEAAGLMGRHDFAMFEMVCRQLEKWRGTKFENIIISCNFTRITLSEENFVEELEKIANKYSFDHSKLAIEITEDALEKDREAAKENVMRAKKLGFRVYLDDMGSGYTSLTNLCDYPIDVVKLDRDILLKTGEPKGKSLFSGIIALAHSMGIEVVCEGVEDETQNTLVTATDCDFVQGWYYSKPIPIESCEGFIENYEK